VVEAQQSAARARSLAGKSAAVRAVVPWDVLAAALWPNEGRTVEAFVVEDPVPETFDYAAAQVRFVNAISNANAMTLYVKNPTTGAELPSSTVAYNAASTFVSVPNGVYDVVTRYAGSSTNVITRTAVSFVAGRVYTISARGDITVTSTTATNRPILDNTANR
jgi:hypothetical protein